MACNKDPTAPLVYFLSRQLVPDAVGRGAYQLAEVARGMRCSSGMTDSSKFFLLKTPGFSWASTAWALVISFAKIVVGAVAYETDSISISPPMYRDKSPDDQV